MIDCPSRFTLVQLQAGDLSPTFAAEVTAHVKTCRSCATQLDDIRINSSLFDERFAEHARALNERLQAEPAPPRRLISPGMLAASAGILAAAAIITIGVLFVYSPDNRNSDPPVVQPFAAEAPSYKGSFSARIIADRAGTQFNVTNDSSLRAGDQLRFSVSVSTPGFLSIISATENGAVFPFYPAVTVAESPEPWVLSAAGETTLPGSIVLDDSRGTEYLMILYSPDIFDRRRLHSRLHQPELKIPGLHHVDGVSVWVVRVTKEND